MTHALNLYNNLRHEHPSQQFFAPAKETPFSNTTAPARGGQLAPQHMAPGTVWSSEEDERLRRLVLELGEKKWTKISCVMGSSKSSKQCRRRWLNHLNMESKKCGWGPEEDQLLLDYHKQMGNKWTEIARMIGGRTDNAVKNRYHALTRRDGKDVVDYSEDNDDSCSVHKDRNTDDSRTLEMWKSSLERLRTWISRRRPQCLEDAVSNAIKAVDEVSSDDGMDIEPSPEGNSLHLNTLPNSCLVYDGQVLTGDHQSSDSTGATSGEEHSRFQSRNSYWGNVLEESASSEIFGDQDNLSVKYCSSGQLGKLIEEPSKFAGSSLQGKTSQSDCSEGRSSMSGFIASCDLDDRCKAPTWMLPHDGNCVCSSPALAPGFIPEQVMQMACMASPSDTWHKGDQSFEDLSFTDYMDVEESSSTLTSNIHSLS